ncbi:hypothetical protein LIER_15773 [Lithospermum erythrorhizon]|uniref:non-specific serine/threonine protein kinase n=1 Tax=Lithospermum erythrorhizon TaxID=34254 RepID=A0AAV3Q6N8_LITER
MDDQNNETNKTLNVHRLELDNLKAIKVLGKGAMGTVFLVHDNSSPSSQFALKVVEKSLPLPGKSDPNRRARWEISVLSSIQENQKTHNTAFSFLPSILGTIETEEFIMWALPYCPGNDLNALRFQQPDHVFSPSIIRFYLAEIICALENLHGMGIVYRDLKPENILIQQSGHVTLTDFDLSCNLISKAPSTTEMCPTTAKNPQKKKPKSARVSPVDKRNLINPDGRERSYSFVGTEEYVAPEIISCEGHEFSVDWWALGVLAFEMLYGTTPFKGNNRKETYQRIVAAPPIFLGKPNLLTDLIQKLLEKDPTRRLGYQRGACEIKEHAFFKGLKWDLLTDVVRPPFIPLRHEDEVKEGELDIVEYFEKSKVSYQSTLWSTSIDEEDSKISLTEF